MHATACTTGGDGCTQEPADEAGARGGGPSTNGASRMPHVPSPLACWGGGWAWRLGVVPGRGVWAWPLGVVPGRGAWVWCLGVTGRGAGGGLVPPRRLRPHRLDKYNRLNCPKCHNPMSGVAHARRSRPAKTAKAQAVRRRQSKEDVEIDDLVHDEVGPYAAAPRSRALWPLAVARKSHSCCFFALRRDLGRACAVCVVVSNKRIIGCCGKPA